MTGMETMDEIRDIGFVKISDDALASIAALAATEVEGVSGMLGNLTNELIARLGVKNLSRGVEVSLEGEKVRIRLSLIIRYGFSVPEVAQKVREKVKSMTENMTGLTVEEVTVNIAGIDSDR